MSRHPSRPLPTVSNGAEVVAGCLVGIGALSLYVLTLQPDVGGPEDTPKFQFLGYVLGSAHPPGYPLYVLLSHAFVQIPIRTIAYRANLFSAVMAAVACVVAYSMARQLGAGRGASAAAALGMAGGAARVRAAVFAEVYSLAAAIAGLTVCLLLSWDGTARLRSLLAAAGAFALGLGNHLTIVGLAPACATYVLLKNRRVLTPRVLGTLALILAIGLSQYALIVVRTRQGAPYLESRAESIPELWRVVTAERFAGERFAFGPRVLLTVHLPAALKAIARDLGPPGLFLCGIGIVGLTTARSIRALLIMGSALGLLAMVVNLAGDLQGFITPILPLVWPFAATGAEYTRQLLVHLHVGPSIASVASVALALAMPAWNIASNYRALDQSDHTEEGKFLRAFYSQVPDRGGLVAHDYQTDMAINYMMLTGEGGPSRGIARVGFSRTEVRGALKDGRRVLAFAPAATVLSAEGFRFERMTVHGPALQDWLEDLPRRTLIVGATAHVPFQLDLRGIGHGAARPIGRLRPFETFAVVTGSSRAQWRNGDDRVGFHVFDGPIEAVADARGPRVERDGHTIAHVDAGLALAVFSDEGSLVRPLEFRSDEPLSVPYQEAVYEIAGEAPCAVLDNAWRDVTRTLETGSWVATIHQRGSVTIETVLDGSETKADVSVLLGNGDVTRITRHPQADGTVVLSTELARTGDYRPAFRFSVSRIPARARARIASGSMPAMTVCAHEPLVHLFPSRSDRTLLRPDFEAEPYFGAGWSGAERTATGRQRRGRDGATLFLPLERRQSYRAVFELDARRPIRINVLVNENLAGSCDIAGPVRCELALSPAFVRDGVNTVTFRLPDASELTLHRVELSRQAVSQSRQ